MTDPAPGADGLDGALGLLGLARRAGSLVMGVPRVREALRTGEVELVILAGDASSGQLQKVRGILEHQDVPARWVASRVTLGRCVGRREISVVAVTKRSFAEQLSSRLPDRPPGRPAEAGPGSKEDVGTDAGG